jgi:hypothetical protein
MPSAGPLPVPSCSRGGGPGVHRDDEVGPLCPHRRYLTGGKRDRSGLTVGMARDRIGHCDSLAAALAEGEEAVQAKGILKPP